MKVKDIKNKMLSMQTIEFYDAIWYSKREKAIKEMIKNIENANLYRHFSVYCDLCDIKSFKDKLNHFCKAHNLPVITIK